jgi:hypothetical protein
VAVGFLLVSIVITRGVHSRHTEETIAIRKGKADVASFSPFLLFSDDCERMRSTVADAVLLTIRFEARVRRVHERRGAEVCHLLDRETCYCVVKKRRDNDTAL